MTPETAALRLLVLSLLDNARNGGLPPIVQLGHPALRRPAVEFDGQLDDDELAAFLQLMRDVMHAAPGVGLAAPQLGVPLRLAVLEDSFSPDPDVARVRERGPLPYFAAINPRWEPLGTETASFYEGCLSFTGYQGVVERHRRVAMSWTADDGTSRSAEFSGWPARIVQHECDHLDGTVYIDRALTRSLASSGEYEARWARPDITEARHALGF